MLLINYLGGGRRVRPPQPSQDGEGERPGQGGADEHCVSKAADSLEKIQRCHYRFVCNNSNLVCSPNVNTFLSSRWSSPTSDNSPESVEVFPSRDPQHHVLKHLLAVRVVLVEARTFSDSSGDYFDEEDSIDNFKQGTLDMPNVQSCDSA